MENKCYIENTIECKNKSIAINTQAIPVMAYSFNVINCMLGGIRKDGLYF